MANRGHNSIAAFQVDEATGHLGLLETAPLGGDWPRDFKLDPAGQCLLVEYQTSHNIVVLRVDRRTGKVTPTGHEVRVSKPVSIAFVPTSNQPRSVPHLRFTASIHAMKIFALCLTLLAVAAPAIVAAPATVTANPPVGANKLMHVVTFKFKPEATKPQIDAVVAAFRALQTKIPTIQDFSWGTNVSPEKLNKGFTHAFVLSFGSDKDRDNYLVHPDHVAFGKLLGPILADVFVIDYWTQ